MSWKLEHGIVKFFTKQSKSGKEIFMNSGMRDKKIYKNINYIVIISLQFFRNFYDNIKRIHRKLSTKISFTDLQMTGSYYEIRTSHSQYIIVESICNSGTSFFKLASVLPGFKKLNMNSEDRPLMYLSYISILHVNNPYWKIIGKLFFLRMN